jgi:hypothetical protein
VAKRNLPYDPNSDDDDDLDDISQRELREEQALHRLGTRNPCCHVCGEKRILPLIRRGRRILCAYCDAEGRGAPTTQLHHAASRRYSDATMPLDISDHRIVTDLGNDHPRRTREKAQDSERLANAAKVRTIVDSFRVLLDVLSEVPESLERLDRDMAAERGEVQQESASE